MKKIFARENNKQALISGLVAVLIFVPFIVIIQLATKHSVDSWPWWGQFALYFVLGMVAVQVNQWRMKRGKNQSKR